MFQVSFTVEIQQGSLPHKEPYATSRFTDLDAGPPKALLGLAPPPGLIQERHRGDQPQAGASWRRASWPRPRLPTSTTSARGRPPSAPIGSAGAVTGGRRGCGAARARGRAERARAGAQSAARRRGRRVAFWPSQRRYPEAAARTGGLRRACGGRGSRARFGVGSEVSERLPEWLFAASGVRSPREEGGVPGDAVGRVEPAALPAVPPLPLAVLPSHAFHLSFDSWVPVTGISGNSQELRVALLWGRGSRCPY